MRAWWYDVFYSVPFAHGWLILGVILIYLLITSPKLMLSCDLTFDIPFYTWLTCPWCHLNIIVDYLSKKNASLLSNFYAIIPSKWKGDSKRIWRESFNWIWQTQVAEERARLHMVEVCRKNHTQSKIPSKMFVDESLRASPLSLLRKFAGKSRSIEVA